MHVIKQKLSRLNISNETFVLIVKNTAKLSQNFKSPSAFTEQQRNPHKDAQKRCSHSGPGMVAVGLPYTGPNYKRWAELHDTSDALPQLATAEAAELPFHWQHACCEYNSFVFYPPVLYLYQATIL